MTPPHIVQLGLPWSYSDFDEETKKFVKEKLALGKKRMEDAGYQYKEFDVTPEEGTASYETYLKDNKVDGVVIGAGIRRTTELGAFMELLVDATRRVAPDARIMFNDGPHRALEATLRWFPPVEGKKADV